MTPEERAAAVTDAWDQTPCTTHDLCSEGVECLQAHIAAAIREAVDAETEACAAIPDEWVQSKSCDSTGAACTHQRLAYTISERIRQRRVSSAS